MPWPVEEIPDEDIVYFRVHRDYFRNGELNPKAFRPQGISMSVDWMRYSTPDQTRRRAKMPAENGIVSIKVHVARTVPGLSVIHEPESVPECERDNRAHTGIRGMTGVVKQAARIAFYKQFQTMGWTIHPDTPLLDP
jgi:hypothetical protein